MNPVMHHSHALAQPRAARHSALPIGRQALASRRRTDSAISNHEHRRRERLLPRSRAADAPAVVLLHGFPSSSNMFRNLIPALADRYRVIAPDYPGFGHSDMPDRAQFPLHLRSLRRHHRHTADASRRLALCAVCHGLRRTRRLSRGAQASRARHCARDSERQRVRGGTQGVLEADQGVLGERPAGAARRLARRHHAGGDTLAIPRWRRRSLARRSERVGPGSGAAGSAGQRRDPARSVLRLPHQPRRCIRSSRNSSASGNRRH